MTRLIYAEIIKLRSTAGPWVVVASAIGLTVFAIGMTGAFAGNPASMMGSPVAQLRWFNLTGVSAFAMVLGILVGTADHRHGTIVPSLLAAPSRGRLGLAKSVSAVVAALVLATGAAAATAVAVPVTLAAIDVKFVAGWGAIAELWVLSAVALAASALIGLGLGLLLARQSAALVVGLVVSFVVTPALTGLAPHLAVFLPGMLEAAFTGSAAGLHEVGLGVREFGRAAAGLLLGGWAVGLVMLGTGRLVWSDAAA